MFPQSHTFRPVFLAVRDGVVSGVHVFPASVWTMGCAGKSRDRLLRCTLAKLTGSPARADEGRRAGRSRHQKRHATSCTLMVAPLGLPGSAVLFPGLPRPIRNAFRMT